MPETLNSWDGFEPTAQPEHQENLQPEDHFKQIQAQIIADWQQERRDGDPDLKIQFVFGRHGTRKDLDIVKQYYKNCDIFIMEHIGWTDNIAQMYQGVSDGLTDPADVERRIISSDPAAKKDLEFQYFVEQLRMLYKTEKKITSIDIPEGGPLTNHFRAARNLFHKLLEKAHTVEEKTEAVKKGLINENAANIEREHYMVSQLPKRIREILDQNPDLQGKSEVKVVIQLGGVHTPVFFMVPEYGGIQPDRVFQSNPYIFNHWEELLRRLRFGEDIDSIDRTLLLKVAFSEDLGIHMQKSRNRMGQDNPATKFTEKKRKLINALSAEDITNIYTLVNEGKGFREATLDIAREKGVDVTGL